MVWGRRRRVRAALARAFPDEWRHLLEERWAQWRTLDTAERAHLEDLIRVLLVDRYWEATRGFRLTAQMRVLIAALATLPILGLDIDYYRRVTSIIVAPSTVRLEGPRPAGNGLYTDEPEAIIGQAAHEGPVIIAWDAAEEQAARPESGRNVVYHEFAHKLDMLGGAVDGTPPLDSSAAYHRWVEVCTLEYERLRRGEAGDLLDPYGAENPGEFFAVITETFFCQPLPLEAEKPALYSVLRDFYRQDPAGRERHARAGQDPPPWWEWPSPRS